MCRSKPPVGRGPPPRDQQAFPLCLLPLHGGAVRGWGKHSSEMGQRGREVYLFICLQVNIWYSFWIPKNVFTWRKQGYYLLKSHYSKHPGVTACGVSHYSFHLDETTSAGKPTQGVESEVGCPSLGRARRLLSDSESGVSVPWTGSGTRWALAVFLALTVRDCSSTPDGQLLSSTHPSLCVDYLVYFFIPPMLFADAGAGHGEEERWEKREGAWKQLGACDVHETEPQACHTPAVRQWHTAWAVPHLKLAMAG